MIKAAPYSFCVCTLIAAGLLSVGIWHLEDRQFAGVIDAQKATIEEKDSTIQKLTVGGSQTNPMRMCIFNANGVIIYDFNASDLIATVLIL